MLTTNTPRPVDTPARAAGAEPLPGYRLLRPLGGGGFGEVWECEAPGGLHKAVKFVGGDHPAARAALAQELAALGRVKGLRHPFLLGIDRAELVGGELLVVTELADGTLLDRARATGGRVPPAELLPLLSEAAEALDLLASRGLQHLDVKPANLLLLGGHLKLGDFGVVAPVGSVRRGAAESLDGVTPRYAAPEVLLRGEASPASDQYALALVAYELLCGRFPFPGNSARKMALLHAYAAPDLSGVTAAAAGVLGRALAKDPADRFASCAEFVRRLAESRPEPSGIAASSGAGDTGVVAWSAVTVPSGAGEAPPVREFDALGRAGRAAPGASAGEVVGAVVRDWLLGAGGCEAGPSGLACRFPVRADRAELLRRLGALAAGCGATLAGVGRDTWEVSLPPGGLLRLPGGRGPLRVAVALPTGGEASASCAASGEAAERARAAEALAAVRSALCDGGDARRWARHPVGVAAVAYPLRHGGAVGPGVEARCADLSGGGARLESASDLPPAGRFYLRLAGHTSAGRHGLLCRVVWRRELGPGHFEFGCRFTDS